MCLEQPVVVLKFGGSVLQSIDDLGHHREVDDLPADPGEPVDEHIADIASIEQPDRSGTIEPDLDLLIRQEDESMDPRAVPTNMVP